MMKKCKIPVPSFPIIHPIHLPWDVFISLTSHHFASCSSICVSCEITRHQAPAPTQGDAPKSWVQLLCVSNNWTRQGCHGLLEQTYGQLEFPKNLWQKSMSYIIVYIVDIMWWVSCGYNMDMCKSMSTAFRQGFASFDTGFPSESTACCKSLFCSMCFCRSSWDVRQRFCPMSVVHFL